MNLLDQWETEAKDWGQTPVVKAQNIKTPPLSPHLKWKHFDERKGAERLMEHHRRMILPPKPPGFKN